MISPTDIRERFGVELSVSATGCWIWGGVLDVKGYGRLLLAPKTQYKLAHRVVFALENGPIPANRVLHHECENQGCVNPAHLRCVTRSEHALLHGNDEKCRARQPAAAAASVAARPAWTHCPQGHEITPDNMYVQPATGTRMCLECTRTRTREYMRRAYREGRCKRWRPKAA